MNGPQRAAHVTPPQPRRSGHWLPALGLLAVLLAAHGVSLWDGLFFDDHWHRAVSRNRGWSFSELVASATVDLSGRLNHLWWQEQSMVWRYARPVSMLVTKLEYHLTGGSPMGVHACSLGWHWLTALLVYGLAVWAGLHRKWAFAAGAVFLIMPHSVFTVGWLAARNALLGGFLFVAAVLAYACTIRNSRSRTAAARGLRLAACLLLWGLSLMSRETAVIFPLVALVLDASFGGWAHLRRRLPFHAVLWLLALGFVCWRLRFFSVEAAPPIYFTRPTSLAYVPWAASKLLQLLFALVFYTPMLMGLATYRGLPGEDLAVHAVMAVLLALAAVWYLLASRGWRGRWVWPIWVLAAFLPVVPIFAMPHFGYLPSIAYAIMVAFMLSGVPVRCRAAVTTLVIAATVWSLGVYRCAWWGIIRAEQVVYADILSTTPPPRPGSKLLFINHPIAAIYAPDALREAWGVDDLDGYVLTFAPHPLVMDSPSVVEQLNNHELLVSAPAPGYFSGLSGRMLLDGTRPGSPLLPGTVVKGDLFDTTVLEADNAGVRKLKFTFHERLDHPRYYFYVSSPERPAYRLRFDLTAPDENADAGLFARARSDDLLTCIPARMEIVRLARPVAVQTASSIQADLYRPSALARVEKWWHRVDAPALNRETRRWQQAHAGTLRQRDYYFAVMNVIQRFVKSDLLLTGGRESGTLAGQCFHPDREFTGKVQD